jgi:hypothetical protein
MGPDMASDCGYLKETEAPTVRFGKRETRSETHRAKCCAASLLARNSFDLRERVPTSPSALPDLGLKA